MICPLPKSYIASVKIPIDAILASATLLLFVPFIGRWEDLVGAQHVFCFLLSTNDSKGSR